MFPRIQSYLRRHGNRKAESDVDLFQCHGASKFSVDGMESLTTLEDGGGDGGDSIMVKVRDPRTLAKQCFFLLEEVLGVIDQVLLEMSPGLAVDKHVLSACDLESHSQSVHMYPSSEVVDALARDGFDASVVDGGGKGDTERLVDLICFGSKEVWELHK